MNTLRSLREKSAVITGALVFSIGATACGAEIRENDKPKDPAATEAQINGILKRTAISIGEMALTEASKDGELEEVIEDSDAKEGYSIHIASSDGEKFYSILVSMNKAPDGELDPSTTYELDMLQEPLEDEKIEVEATIVSPILDGRRIWYGTFKDTSGNNQTPEAMDTIDPHDPPSLRQVQLLSEIIKTQAEITFIAPRVEEEREDRGSRA